MALATEANPIEDLVGRLFMEGVGTMHVLTVYLGVKLGLWRALTEGGAQTVAELADATSLDPWYVHEWLQAETIAGLVAADGEDLWTARFTAAEGIGEVLVEETSPAYLGGMALACSVVGNVLPNLVEAFRTGDGVSYETYGQEAVEAQAAFNRPAYVHDLAANWIGAYPELTSRLNDKQNPARVADVGCGVGWASIELAKAFPHAHIDGLDADEESISQARRNAAEHGVADRVTFEVVDAAADGPNDTKYDLILFLECVHDMGRPVEALAAARKAMADGGTVIVMDEKAGETIQVGDPTELFFGCASVLWCLPQSRIVPDCEAPGTVMRPATFEAIAKRAGWSGVEVLDIEHDFFRFYCLQP